MNLSQEKLRKMYNAQQTEIGQAGLRAQKELAAKLRSKGIEVPPYEVGCMIEIGTGKKGYFHLKG